MLSYWLSEWLIVCHCQSVHEPVYGKFQKSVEYFVTECRWLNHGEKQLETFGQITMISLVLFNEDILITNLD